MSRSSTCRRPSRPRRLVDRQPGWTRSVGRRVRPRGVDTGFFPAELRKRFDIIGFDPRGRERSTEIRCIDNLDPQARLDPSPDDAGTSSRRSSMRPATMPTNAPSATRRRCRICPPMPSPATWTSSAPPIGEEQADLPRVLVRHADRLDLRGPLPRPHPGDGARRRHRPGARSRAASGPVRPRRSRRHCRASSTTARRRRPRARSTRTARAPGRSTR